jgi:hypothetical protein
MAESGCHFMMTLRAWIVARSIPEVFSMPFRNRILARLLVCATAFGLLSAVQLSRAPAQQPKGPERLSVDNERDYKPTRLRAMFQGDEPTDKKFIELAAKVLSYRLTWSDKQVAKDGLKFLVREAVNELDVNRKEDRTKNEAVQYFDQQMVARLKEVLPNPKPIASINAALILEKMTSLGIEEATDPLIDALTDKDMNDGTKFCAAEGLKEFFRLGYPPPDGTPVVFKDKAREARAVQALIALIDRRPPQSPPPTHEELDGFQVLRREAIRALALSRYPVILDAKGAAQGKTALTLLKVMRNDGLNPPPRLDEQVEAAVGIAMLKLHPHRDFNSDYQIDVAAYHLGRFLVDLARKNQDRNSEKNSRSRHPWKTFGARLGVALTALKAEATAMRKNNPTRDGKTAENVIKIVDLSLPFLSAIERDGDPNSNSLAESLELNKRDGEPVYKNDKDSVVKPATSELTSEPPADKAEKPEKSEKPAKKEVKK